MHIFGASVVSHPADVYELDVHGLGKISLYHDAELIEYSLNFKMGSLTVTFKVCEGVSVFDLVFKIIRNVEVKPDPGVLHRMNHVEFEQLVFGTKHLNPHADPSSQQNVELATNLFDIRFLCDELEVSVRL